MRGVFSTPSPAELVPSPYKQGESAIRFIYIVLLILLKHLTHPIQRLDEGINFFL